MLHCVDVKLGLNSIALARACSGLLLQLWALMRFCRALLVDAPPAVGFSALLQSSARRRSSSRGLFCESAELCS